MSKRYVIGIDAGGTKTVGLLANEDGQITTKARGGGANMVVHGELAVARQLAFEEALPFVQAGGVFKACPSLHARLEAILDLPQARPIRLEGEPAQGAVTLALGLLDK